MFLKVQDKKSKRSQKAVGIKIFFLFLLGDRSIQEAQKHTDPIDPDPDSDLDPQNWFKAKWRAEAQYVKGLRPKQFNGNIKALLDGFVCMLVLFLFIFDDHWIYCTVQYNHRFSPFMFQFRDSKIQCFFDRSVFLSGSFVYCTLLLTCMQILY